MANKIEQSTPEQIIVSRQETKEEQEIRAENRNKYRAVWQKMFGVGKTTDMDVAMEEALKMDSTIDKEIKEGRADTIEDALNNVDQLPEFQLKGTERIDKEEYARAKTLQVGKAIVNNEFNKVFHILFKEQFREGLDEETMQVIDEHTTALVKEHVANLAQEKDGENFVDAIYWFASRLKSGDLPVEAVKSPEIQSVIREHIISWFSTFFGSPETFVGELEKFSQLGLLNKEEIIQSPEIQKLAKEEFIHWMGVDPKYFAQFRDEWAEFGIINQKEANMWPEIVAMRKG